MEKVRNLLREEDIENLDESEQQQLIDKIENPGMSNYRPGKDFMAEIQKLQLKAATCTNEKQLRQYEK